MNVDDKLWAGGAMAAAPSRRLARPALAIVCCSVSAALSIGSLTWGVAAHYYKNHIEYGPILGGGACLNGSEGLHVCLDHYGQWSYSNDASKGKQVKLHPADNQKAL